MRHDMVVLRVSFLERRRKALALGRIQFYEKLGLHFLTGAKLLGGGPVSLETAKRVASVLGIHVQKIIKVWGDDVRNRRSDLGLLGKSSRRTAQQAEAVVGVTD